MRSVSLVLAMLLASAAARANCAHDLQELRVTVDRALKTKPGPQSGTAAQELERYDRSRSTDEVDCLNTIVRVKRALNAPPPAPREDYLRGPVAPVQPIPAR
jgi:hypothetical protein